MPTPKPEQGLNAKARSPGSIQNDEYNESSGVHRTASGTIGAIAKIIADATAVTPVGDKQPLWVCNTTASWQYVWTGKQGAVPLTIDATTSLGIPPNQAVLVYADESDDPAQSVVVKASNSGVKIAVLKY